MELIVANDCANWEFFSIIAIILKLFFVKEISNYPLRINVPPLCKLRIIYRSKDTRLYKNVLQFYKGLFELWKTLPGEILYKAQFLRGMYINGKISS